MISLCKSTLHVRTVSGLAFAADCLTGLSLDRESLQKHDVTESKEGVRSRGFIEVDAESTGGDGGRAK